MLFAFLQDELAPMKYDSNNFREMSRHSLKRLINMHPASFTQT